MTYIYEHHFKDGMGSFVTRAPVVQDLPTSPNAVQIVNGKLELRLLRLNNQLVIGHVWDPKFSFTEGRIEFCMKFHAPPGAHGAAWLQSVTPYETVDDHEIDVAEHFGDDKTVHHSIWTGPWPPKQPYKDSANLTPSKWNVYEVDCRRGGYTWKINGVEVGKSKRADDGFGSKRPKNIIISLLSDTWERPRLDMVRLKDYYVLCDWVRVSE
jgi:hypothetical protein